MVIRPEDYQQAEQSNGYFEGKPYFVVEVISPSERKSRRMQKVGLYLEAGAGAVVEVDDTKRLVILYRSDREAAEVSADRINWPFAADLNELFL